VLLQVNWLPARRRLAMRRPLLAIELVLLLAPELVRLRVKIITLLFE
jgi:hypothetical protein